MGCQAAEMMGKSIATNQLPEIIFRSDPVFLQVNSLK
jgi:hypothetical protein